jgi:hypothetical protein
VTWVRFFATLNTKTRLSFASELVCALPPAVIVVVVRFSEAIEHVKLNLWWDGELGCGGEYILESRNNG